MVLFENKDKDLEKVIKEAFQKEVCSLCNNSSLCLDSNGYSCDLVNPIIVTVQRRPADNKSSCTGCKFDIDNMLDGRCMECRRMHDDFEYKDFFVKRL